MARPLPILAPLGDIEIAAAPEPDLSSLPAWDTLNYVRTQLEVYTSSYPVVPDWSAHSLVSTWCTSRETRAIVEEVLKARLKLGGVYAYKALAFLSHVPTSSLSAFLAELTELSRSKDPWLANVAVGLQAQALNMKVATDNNEAKARWDTWTSHVGMTRAAWPALPVDKTPLLPNIETPPEPDGWKWLLVPEWALTSWK